jgi:hypothetical protein
MVVNDGWAMVNAEGGIAPYSIVWNNVATTNVEFRFDCRYLYGNYYRCKFMYFT